MKKKLYLKTDASCIGLGTSLLQLRDDLQFPWDEAPDNRALHPTAFASKSLTSKEMRYDKTEREALALLHSLEKFHHYCLACKVSIITDHKPLLAILRKEVATLPQRLQQILLCINQYTIRILHKMGLHLYMAKWLSTQNHTECKDKKNHRYVAKHQ